MMFVLPKIVLRGIACLFIAFLGICKSYSQVLDKDSLINLSFEELYNGYSANKAQKDVSIQYARAFLEKGRAKKDIDLESYGLFYMAELSENEVKVQFLDSIIQLTANTKLKYDTFPELAYISLADYYYKQRLFDKALPILLKGLESSKINGKVYEINRINYFIALIKSERLEKVNEALTIVRSSYAFFSKDGNKQKYTRQYLECMYALGDMHRKLKQNDSASFYNKLGKKEATYSNENELGAYFTFSEGLNEFYQGAFKAAEDSLLQSLTTLYKKEDIANLSLAYNYLGLAYLKQDKKDIAISYLEKTDSIFTSTGIFNIEVRPGFEVLMRHYSETNNMEKQLEIVQNLLEIDRLYNTQYKDIRNLMEVEYDKKNLLEERDQLINSLAQTKKISEVFGRSSSSLL